MSRLDGGPDGQCVPHGSVTLLPKRRVSADALARCDIASMIELRRN